MKGKTICILIIVICALAFSGCADKKNTTSELTSSQTSPGNNIATADATLTEENVSITDTEIQDMGQEITELEALITEMEKEENITIEEI